MDMMKEVNQSIKRKRWLQFPKMIVIVLVVMLIVVFLSSCSNNQSSWSLLKNKQFVLVENGDPSYKEFVVGFDLKEQECSNSSKRRYSIRWL